jgi:hypothetical protein
MTKVHIHVEIAQYLRDNPKAFIAYWGNGDWEIYPHKPRGIEVDEFKLKPVYRGADYNNLNGYVPTLVEIMAIALKVRVWSI